MKINRDLRIKLTKRRLNDAIREMESHYRGREECAGWDRDIREEFNIQMRYLQSRVRRLGGYLMSHPPKEAILGLMNCPRVSVMLAYQLEPQPS